MSISATVAALADVLRDRVMLARPDAQQLLVFLAAVGRMPEFRAEARLDDWERTVQAVELDSIDAGDPFLAVAEQLFALGRFNLYSRIQPVPTRQHLRSALANLRDLGCLDLPDESLLDVTKW
ncbi:MAG TPA: hypothetical protein VHE30_22850 [Polyangiaceae bacterium]|nr:hypothetical protein [Polyangiaceae bacterium]